MRKLKRNIFFPQVVFMSVGGGPVNLDPKMAPVLFQPKPLNEVVQWDCFIQPFEGGFWHILATLAVFLCVPWDPFELNM